MQNDVQVTESKQPGRLRRTAWSLPTAVVRDAVADMKRRVGLVVQAKGGLFNE